MSDRHIKTPQETFLSDQALAHARATVTPGTLVIVLDYAADGICTWCDCDLGPGSPHSDSTYRCAGCPADAYYVVRILGAPVETLYPVCQAHQPDVIATLTTLVNASG